MDARKILEELKDKARFVEWRNNSRKEYYAVFAKSFREKIREKDVSCFDLKDMGKK